MNGNANKVGDNESMVGEKALEEATRKACGSQNCTDEGQRNVLKMNFSVGVSM